MASCAGVLLSTRRQWPNSRPRDRWMGSAMSDVPVRVYKDTFLIVFGHRIPSSARICLRSKADRDCICCLVAPHVPELFVKIGRTKALYSRMRRLRPTLSSRLNRLYRDRRATVARLFRLWISAKSPKRLPSCLVLLQSSFPRSTPAASVNATHSVCWWSTSCSHWRIEVPLARCRLLLDAVAIQRALPSDRPPCSS